MFSNKFITVDENLLTLICAFFILISDKGDIFFAILFSSIFSFINILNENYFLTYSCILCVAYLSLYSINMFTSIGFAILYSAVTSMGLQYIHSANDIFLMNICLLLCVRILAIISNYILKIAITLIIMFILISKFNKTFLDYFIQFI